MSETCPGTKALAALPYDLTVLLLEKSLLSESCYGKQGKSWEGLKVRSEVVCPGLYWLGVLLCTDYWYMRWIYFTGERVSASISILHVTYTWHLLRHMSCLKLGQNTHINHAQNRIKHFKKAFDYSCCTDDWQKNSFQTPAVLPPPQIIFFLIYTIQMSLNYTSSAA